LNISAEDSRPKLLGAYRFFVARLGLRWARSLAATLFTAFGVPGLERSLAAFDAVFLLVAIWTLLIASGGSGICQPRGE
jgi:hypothetical protein